MAIELVVPSAGESITEVQIGEWRKRVGDFVDRDESLVEIETDKASMDLPSPARGRVRAILKAQGDAAAVGETIAVIDETDEGSAAGPSSAATSAGTGASAAAVAAPERAPVAASVSTSPSSMVGRGEPVATPAARRALSEAGLKAEQVPGTGRGGRIMREDVERAAQRRPAGSQGDAAAGAGAGSDSSRQEEVVPMTLLRRKIAERLVRAQHSAAMLTTFNEIDMGEVIALRQQHQEAFSARYGIKLGFMSFFVKAAIDALRQFPQVNAEVRGTDIVYHNYFDVGVAVSTERGLVVPVLRNAERLSFSEVEKAIADFAQRARDKKILPDELSGGTFTISNGGVFGSLMSTPILNPPQSGILGLHATQDRPVARAGAVVIRPMMYVALSYDHRIIDGREAVGFVKRVKECIEHPARMLVEV